MKKKVFLGLVSLFSLMVLLLNNQEAKAVMAMDCKDGHESTGNQSWGTGSDRWKLKCDGSSSKVCCFS